jgi:UTP--glucose-1-phosphate uridylyltransferase
LERLLEDKLKLLQEEAQKDVAVILEPVLNQVLISVQSGPSQGTGDKAEDFIREMRKRLQEEREKQQARIEAQKQLLETAQKIVKEEVDVCYIRQKEAKGLGHAVLRAEGLVGIEPLAVVLADDIIDATHKGKPCAPCLGQLVGKYESRLSLNSERPLGAIMAVMEVEPKDTRKYGIVDIESKTDDGLLKVCNLVEKPDEHAPPNWAIIGRYVLAPAIFDSLRRTKAGAGGEIQLTDGLNDLLQTHDIYAWPFEGKRYDAGDKLGFLKATVELAAKHDDLGKEFREYLDKEFREWRRNAALP